MNTYSGRNKIENSGANLTRRLLEGELSPNDASSMKLFSGRVTNDL